MGEKVNVGLIGYGYWGRIYHRAISEINGVTVKFICDANSVIRDQLQKGIMFFDDPHKAIDEGGADAIFVITPAETHKDIIMHALKYGVDTFVEKPALLSSSDLDQVLNSRPSGTIFFPGHIYAYNDKVKALIDSVERADNEIISVFSSRKAFGPIRRDVGCIWDLFPHDLTVFDMLEMGDPVSISCKGLFPLGTANEDIAHCDIVYSKGATSSSDLNWIYPYKVREVSVLSSRAIHVFNEMDSIAPIRYLECPKGVGLCANEVAYKRMGVDQYTTKINVQISEPLKNMIISFINAVSGCSNHAFEAEVSRAKNIIPVIEAGIKSMKKDGARVNL